MPFVAVWFEDARHSVAFHNCVNKHTHTETYRTYAQRWLDGGGNIATPLIRLESFLLLWLLLLHAFARSLFFFIYQSYPSIHMDAYVHLSINPSHAFEVKWFIIIIIMMMIRVQSFIFLLVITLVNEWVSEWMNEWMNEWWHSTWAIAMNEWLNVWMANDDLYEIVARVCVVFFFFFFFFFVCVLTSNGDDGYGYDDYADATKCPLTVRAWERETQLGSNWSRTHANVYARPDKGKQGKLLASKHGNQGDKNGLSY